MMKDPVCGMQVDEKKAPATSTYQGQKYAFCGSECKEKFDKNPERFAHAKRGEGVHSKT
jgi:YHS domain-containing protein